MQQQAQYMRATQGIGLAQWQLQQQYQPQFWALQDQMTGVQRGYQTWQLDFQQRQMEMQNQFWMQNMAMNRQQQMMQRGWTRQDWGFQDLTRGLQWQWRQEDFAEQARFMTGRERRLAERQMGRETLMYGLEGEQIDKQRQRQEELWRLEDRRYQVALSQHQEEVRMQEEQLNRTRKYYEDVWAIQDKQRDLEREYWRKQQELQRQSLTAAASYNEKQILINQTMFEFGRWVDEQMGKKSLFNPDTLAAIAEALGMTVDEIERLLNLKAPGNKGGAMGGSYGGSAGEGSGGGDYGEADVPTQGEIPGPGERQFGGRVYAGETYQILEGGKPEIYKPDFTGTIVPIADPWGTHVFTSPKEGGGVKQVHLVLNVGDMRLLDKILDLVDQEIRV
jgi:hypothetical protein